MKHFSHFIKRGAKYVEIKGEFASNCSAFKNPDGSYVVLAYNPYEKNHIVTFGDKSYELEANSINTILL